MEATFTLRNPITRKIIAQSNLPSQKEVAFYWDAGVYLVTIEAPGYQIDERSVVIEVGEPVHLSVEMQGTRIPLGIQRLFSF